MIALYRKAELLEACWLRKPEKLDELLALAQGGDSLHNVDDMRVESPESVLATVREQRSRGEGKQL